jgi:CubicO group peptidase (beta-lactamase class C family)
LASVTKPIFAYAVLIASEEGTLPLNSPLGPEGATVAHVLAHASGLGPEGPDPVTTPGTRRIYSNAGFELLGRALAAASGLSAADYMREAVCEPLGMNDTWLEGSPAHGAVSSVNDLVRFCHEWITPKLVSGITVGAATTPVMGELAGVLPGFGRHDPNPWGLGVEIRGHKQPHWTGAGAAPETFGHFGAAGTFVWVDPNTSQFAVCLTDTRFGPWAAELWPRFNQAIIGPTSATGQES